MPAPTVVLRAEMAMNGAHPDSAAGSQQCPAPADTWSADFCSELKPGTTECEECWLAHQYFRRQKAGPLRAPA